MLTKAITSMDHWSMWMTFSTNQHPTDIPSSIEQMMENYDQIEAISVDWLAYRRVPTCSSRWWWSASDYRAFYSEKLICASSYRYVYNDLVLQYHRSYLEWIECRPETTWGTMLALYGAAGSHIFAQTTRQLCNIRDARHNVRWSCSSFNFCAISITIESSGLLFDLFLPVFGVSSLWWWPHPFARSMTVGVLYFPLVLHSCHIVTS